MKKVNRQYVDNLVNKMLNETLEERANELVSKIKTNVNELGGMEDDHPKFGKLNFSKMSPEEIEALMNNYVDSDDEDEEEHETMRGRFFDDEDEGDDEWTELDIDSDTELDEGFFDSDDESEEDAEYFEECPECGGEGCDSCDHEGHISLRDNGEYDSDLDEGFDDPYIQRARGGRDYSSKEFKRIPKGANIDMKNFRDDSITPGKYLHNKMGDISDLLKRRNRDDDDDDYDYDFGDDEGGDIVYEMEENLCECGGNMYEGECMECGKSYGSMDEDIYDVDDLDDSNEFDYVEEGLLDDEGDGIFDYSDEEPNQEACDYHKKNFGPNDERTKRFCKSEMTERLHGRQRVLDKNKNNRIDAKDFEMLRGKKSETKEGKKFPDLSGDGKVTRKDVLLGRGVKLDKNGKKSKIKESVQLTEDEMIELIENIIKEEEKLRTIGGKPKGLSKYEQVHEKDGKQNDEYLKSVAAKMKEYLKDGSKGEYTESPKHFPKSNGQLAKMKAKKYTMSDDGNEFLNSYMRPGMEDLVPEEIEYDEEWVSDSIEGSSRTGNNPEWANAEETDLGKKINKKRKDKKFHKAKETAYRKTRVPVSDGTGENSGSGIHIKESETKQGKVLNEEFNKIQHLMSYSRKTQ